MHRRTLKALALTAALSTTLALAACGGGGGGGSSDSGAEKAKGPITVWYSNNEQEVAWGKAMVAKWNEAHPDEKVDARKSRRVRAASK